MEPPAAPVRFEPTITVGKAYKSVTAKAAKKKAQSFKIGAKSSSGGKLSYKVVKSNKKMKFKAGTVTLKKGKYKPGKTYSMRVKATSAAHGDYLAASKTFALIFKVKR